MRNKTPNLQLHETKRYLERFDQLGLANKLPKELKERADRAESLRKEAAAQTVSLGPKERAIVGQLADGTTTTDNAAQELMAAREQGAVEEATKKLLNDASKSAAYRASVVLGRHAETLVTDTLAPFGAKLVDSLTKAMQDVPPEVTTADEAIRAGGKVAAAWKVRAEAVEAWGHLMNLLKQMRSDDLIEGRGPDLFLYYRHPERRTRGTREDDLADAVRRNAEPRIVTEVQAQAELDEDQRRIDEERHAQPSTGRPIDSIGHRISGQEMDALVNQVKEKTA